jgi:fructoselysine-6-P-deglycase FrlB-like protein
VSPGDRAAALLADIKDGPDELAAVLAAQAEAVDGVPLGALGRPAWRLVGMGSSHHAALDASARLRAAGRDAHAELASASAPSPGGRDTLVIAISASGRTPEVVAAARRHHGTSFIVGLTADPRSPLAEVADALVPLRAGAGERSGIATQTYRATVAALARLTTDRAPADLEASLVVAPDALRALLAEREAWAGPAADLLDDGRPVHVLGDGIRAGIVEQAALMLREAPRIPAVTADTGDWLHTGLYTLFPGDPVLLLAGSPADEEAIGTVRARGGRLVAVGHATAGADAEIPLPDAAADPIVRALVEPAVAELLAAELWRRTTAVAVET